MRISLINMPFAPVGAPSIGLAQIESVTRKRFGRQVDVRTLYLNLDFAAKIKGSGFYNQAVSSYGRITGVADWFFRSAAFPDARDNIDEYLARYYFDEDPESEAVVDFIRDRRQESYDFLDDLIEKYELAASDVVGFTLCFFQSAASIAMACRLKRVNPEITVVFGGPAVKGVLGKTLVDNIPAVDYLFSGAALVSFPALISALLADDKAAAADIQGVFTAGAESTSTARDEVGANIDINTEIPLDYTPFLDKFAACVDEPGTEPFLLTQTSRGCWWADRQRCAFCGLNRISEKFEAMAPQTALRHVNSVLKYSDRVSYFVACDNITPPGYYEKVFAQLSIPAGVFMKYETRSDITERQMRVLCDAGVRCVQPGVEALSTESLKLMRKGITAFGNICFLKNCIRHNLFAEWNLLLFSPGESESVYEKYAADIPRLVHLQPPVDVFPVEFVRDSHYFEQAHKFGLELEPHESLFHIYPFDYETIKKLSYRFSDRNADAKKMDYWLDHLRALVAAWRRAWNVEPQKRPRLILWRDQHSAVIYDSRDGEGVSHRIADFEEDLLTAMRDTPMAAHQLAQCCGITESFVCELLEEFTRRRLLFEEGGRYLSLAVVETE